MFVTLLLIVFGLKVQNSQIFSHSKEELIVMSPTGYETGKNNADLIIELDFIWA